MKRNKPYIKILHGWTYDVGKWTTFIDELESVGISSEIFKIPGLTSPIDKAWGLDDYCSWLEQKLKGKRDIVLLGHSFGGQIAIKYASLHPDKIKKLILIDSSGIRDRSILKTLKRSLFWIVAKAGKVFTESAPLRKLLYKVAREKNYYEASPKLRKTMTRILKDEIVNDLPKLEMPTCIIWGSKDKTTPLSLAHIFDSKISKSELHIIDQARHGPQFTNRKEVAQIIKEFLK